MPVNGYSSLHICKEDHYKAEAERLGQLGLRMKAERDLVIRQRDAALRNIELLKIELALVKLQKVGVQPSQQSIIEQFFGRPPF